MSGRRSTALLIPFVVGLLFLSGAAVTFARTLNFVIGASRTEASFAGSVSKSGGNHGGRFLYPRFRFIAADGRTRTVTSRSGSTDQPYGDGDKITVLYDPRDPEHAEIDSIWLWIAPLFLAPFGLFFSAIPAIVWLLLRRKWRRVSV